MSERNFGNKKRWAKGPLFLLRVGARSRNEPARLGATRLFMMSASEIEHLIAPSVEALGYDLVRVSWQKGGGATLQIMAERHDGSMNADNCAELSRIISAILDVEDLVEGKYVLEVSSPGIDRPLVRIDDFERFAGFVASIETKELIQGRRRFRGKLQGAGDADKAGEGYVRIKVDDTVFTLPHDKVARAKLVLTDDLIAAGRGRGH